MSLIDFDCDNIPKGGGGGDVRKKAKKVGASPAGGGGGGGTSLNKPYRFVPHQKVCFLCCYGLKRGKDFAHFGLESGMAFEGSTGVYERICCFKSK